MSTPTRAIDEALLQAVEEIAERAGEVILGFYSRDIAVTRKADASPVTEADEAAERAILPALAALTPEIPAISEEAVSKGQAPDAATIARAGRFWLVDPLDGTREYINRNGEFTVNIALIESGRPVLGVVHLPALAVTYGGIAGKFAESKRGGKRQRIAVRKIPQDGAIVLSSRSHGDEYGDEKLSRRNQGGKLAHRRQRAEILPGGGRHRRSLSATRPHHGVGYGCRTCSRARRRRRRDATRWRRTHLWQSKL